MNFLRLTFFTIFFALIVSNSYAIIKNHKLLELWFEHCMTKENFNIGGQFEFCGCGANLLYQKLDDEDFINRNFIIQAR